MNETTRPDLDAIQARVDAATEGPWIVFGSLPQWENEEDLSFGPDNAPEVGTVTEGLGNAEFIAHARTDVPALLALVRSQQAKIERVEELVRYLELLARGDRHYAGRIRAALTATEEP